MSSDTFVFAPLGWPDGLGAVMRERNRFKRFFEIAEQYMRDHDLALFRPEAVSGATAETITPESFNYIIYARDDPRGHAYALADLFYRASKDKTVTCMRRLGGSDYAISVQFRQLMRVRLLRAWAHVDEHVPAPFTGALVHTFSSFLVLLNMYRKLLDPLGASEWNGLLEGERRLREQIIDARPTVDLVENHEKPHAVFSDVLDLIRSSPRILIDPYVVVSIAKGAPCAPQSQRVQYVTQKKLEEEEVVLQNVLKDHTIETSIRNLKVPGFEHVQKLAVSVIDGSHSTSVVDVFNFGNTMLVPHHLCGSESVLRVASLPMTGFALLLDYINVPSVAEVSDFMVKKKKFLLSKLKLVGHAIDAAVDKADPDALFPKEYSGVYIDPFILEKMLTKGPPEIYVPYSKFKVLQTPT